MKTTLILWRKTFLPILIVAWLGNGKSPNLLAMEAGFAERDITPAVGAERPGGYVKNFHREVHDACKVRAGVFSDGSQRVALVGIDALLIRASVVEAARKRIEAQCGIPGTNVMVAASHSHSAGPTGMVQPGEYDQASEFVQQLAYHHSSLADAAYLTRVEQAIVEAVVEAHTKSTQAACSIDRGRADQVSFNRRFRMRNGLTHTNPRQGNPETLEPAGPIDPEVGVLGAWSKDKQLLGCIVNFACHCTTSPGGISADYVYYIEQAIRGVYGQEVIVVFLNGASGDIIQYDNRSPYQLAVREEAARRVGGSVGAEAIKALVRAVPGELVPVAARQKILSIPRRQPRVDRVQQAMAIARGTPQRHDGTEWVFAKELVMLDAKIEHEPMAAVEVQAIQVGPAVFLSNPAEYFCQYGLEIKAGSSFPFTFPVSLANDCVGYVPTEEAFGPHGGGYETRLTSYSNLTITAGRSIADACVELSRQLQPGPLPNPASAPAYTGQAWSYGNNPPEVD